MLRFCAFWPTLAILCFYVGFSATLCNFMALFALFGSLGPFTQFCQEQFFSLIFALFRVK